MTLDRGARGVLARAGVVAAMGWLAACAALTISRRRYFWPDVSALASTPSGVAHGRVWTLLTSALPVSRYPFAELAGCALAVGMTIRLLDGLRFWAVALASHVGSALVAYAGIGVVWLVVPGAASQLAGEQDYGISAIWLGAVGAVVVVLHRRGRRRTALTLAATAAAASAALLAVSDELALAEHALAPVIGAATARALMSTPQPAEGATRQADASRPRDGRSRPSAGRCPSARMAASPARARPSDPS